MFTDRYWPGEYQLSGAGWDEVADHPAFNDPNPFIPDRIHQGTWDEFLVDLARHGITDPVCVDPYNDEVSEGHHRIVAVLTLDLDIPFLYE